MHFTLSGGPGAVDGFAAISAHVNGLPVGYALTSARGDFPELDLPLGEDGTQLVVKFVDRAGNLSAGVQVRDEEWVVKPVPSVHTLSQRLDPSFRRYLASDLLLEDA